MDNFNANNSNQAPEMHNCPLGHDLIPDHHSVPPAPLPKILPIVQIRFVDEEPENPPSFADSSVLPPAVSTGGQKVQRPRASQAALADSAPRHGNKNAPPSGQNEKQALVLQNTTNAAPSSRGKGKDGRSRCTWNKGVTRYYPKGINGRGRSDYENTDNIPVFGTTELEKERKNCGAIFEILQKNTRTSVKTLFVEVEKCDGLGFTDMEQLQTFLEARPHLFEKTWKWETVKNRGFGYRRGMVYLSCIILNKESEHTKGAKLSEIFEEVAELPTYHMEDMWADDYLWSKKLKMDDFLHFLRKNSSIFELTILSENDFANAHVKIKPGAKGVLSLWDSTLLPIVHDYRQLQDGQPFFDKSRNFTAMGHIGYSCDHYARVVITEGLFVGKSVHVDPSVANLKGRRMSEVYPPNSKAAVIFYFSLFYKEHFHCEAIKSENQLEDNDPGYIRPDEESSVETTIDTVINGLSDLKS